MSLLALAEGLDIQALLVKIALWVAALLLSAGISWHYTAKYYKAVIKAQNAERTLVAAQVLSDHKLETLRAQSISAADGVKLAVAQIQLDNLTADNADIMGRLGHAVGSIADLQRLLDTASSGSGPGGATETRPRIVLGAKDTGDDLADCRSAATIATRAATLFDGELQFCTGQLHAWVNRENTLEEILK